MANNVVGNDNVVVMLLEVLVATMTRMAMAATAVVAEQWRRKLVPVPTDRLLHDDDDDDEVVRRLILILLLPSMVLSADMVGIIDG
jgi:hypothetical protein